MGASVSSFAAVPRICAPAAPVDLTGAERAAKAFLLSLGLDLTGEAMRDTPRRMAHAYAEMLTAPGFDVTTFPNDENYDELVVVEGIELRSLCEHHMLPFTGVAHLGYLPGNRIIGLSKLARMVTFFAGRPQTQERLTQQIADELQAQLQPRGLGVVIKSEHACLGLRGARARGSWTTTSALHGQVRENPALRAEFLSLTRNARA